MNDEFVVFENFLKKNDRNTSPWYVLWLPQFVQETKAVDIFNVAVVLHFFNFTIPVENVIFVSLKQDYSYEYKRNISWPKKLSKLR